MNIGLYQGASSLAALERWQETLSQNINASSLPGFKKTEMAFDAVLGGVKQSGAGGGFGKENSTSMPRQSAHINLAQGELNSTGNELDFAIQGPGFFQIQSPDGQTGYTRNGQFRLSPERTITTSKGHPVMGDSGPITLRPGGGRISINEEGTIVQGETAIGKIAIFDFADPSKLRRIADGLFAPADPGTLPTTVERPSVVGGALESSNVSPLREMVNLITLSRAYEANQRLILANDDTMEKAIQSLGNPIA